MSKAALSGFRVLLSSCLMLAVSTGCAGPEFREGPSRDNLPRSRELKTANRANEVARTVLTDPDQHRLTFPAFLVGVEKGNANKVGAPALRGVDRDALPRPEARKKLKGFLNNPRAMFISHVVEFRGAPSGNTGGRQGSPNFAPVPLYNAYAQPPAAGGVSPRSAWLDAEDAVDQLRARVAAAATEQRATHLIFWSTGWNNTQFETTSSLQELGDSLMAAAAADGKAEAFRPLFVAMSWSSYWPGLPGETARVSLRAKANDADEVGIVAAGRVIARVLIPVSDSLPTRPKVVAIGHSLGARVVTWGAVSAGSGLTGGTAEGRRPVDLVAGLQGALSANAFVVADGAAKGSDGAPFGQYGLAAKRLMYTSSDADIMRFLPLAYVGKASTHEDFGGRYPVTFEQRRVLSAAREVPVSLDRPLPVGDGWDHVLLVDASRIIGDHNDVRNASIGSLLWQAMR